MLCLKKLYREELLQLAILLSLLRVDPDSYLGYDIPSIGVDIHDLNIGTSYAHFTIPRQTYIHPKSLDSVLLSYEREVFEDLNALGRYNRIRPQNLDVAAYLLNVDGSTIPSDAFDSTSILDSSSLENGSILPADSSPSTSGTATSTEDDPCKSGIPASVADLTQEDMDLIEVLWKQDVDLGFSLDLFNPPKPESPDSKVVPVEDDDVEKLKALEALKKDSSNGSIKSEEDNESTTADDPWAGLAYTIDLETGEYVLKGSGIDELSSSAGRGSSAGTGLTDEEPSALIDLPEFSLEEALQLVGLDEDSTEVKTEKSGEPATVKETEKALKEDTEPPEVVLDNSNEELGILSDMIQTTQFHHPHHRSFQGRMPFVRTMSMEQRWQDLANLLSLPGDATAVSHPFAHHHHHHNYSTTTGAGTYMPENTSRSGVLLHNATLAPPIGDLNSTGHYPSMTGSSNLGSAVATSMNLTNSSEPMGDSGPNGGYKMESQPDMMYPYQNNSEINQTTEGFLSSILNDEDLQLMDMAMNEGMYTMRMLESNNSNNASSVASMGTSLHAAEERMDASSDSAVSSMGSERVPSLSDGEWMETGSDSGQATGDHYSMDYHGATKYRPYDYSYTSRQHGGTGVTPTDATHRMPPMAQKKHQMFGKRYFQEQSSGGSSLGSHGATPGLPQTPIKYEYGEAATGAVAPGNAFSGPVEGAVGPKPPEIKFSCSMEFVRHHAEARPSLEHITHNHSYHLPPESAGTLQRPLARDKQKGRKSEEAHMNRDEKRARAMNIPLTVNDIINLPMDEFNERLSKYDLSEAQLSLIRDIRRRGKNKVAAQNCRKRKLDQILSLADEVKEMRDRKSRLLRERDFRLQEIQRAKEKFSQLYRHVFQHLRDPDGNPYSPYEYSLQQSADGSVLLVPRTNSSAMLEPDLNRQKHKEHDAHHKE